MKPYAQSSVWGILAALAFAGAVACSDSPSDNKALTLHAPRQVTPQDCTPMPATVVPLGTYAQTTVGGASLFFNDSVVSEDRQRVIDGIEAVQAYLNEAPGPSVEPVCIEVRATQSSLAGSASATGAHVVIYTTDEGWPVLLPWHLQMVAAHEYVHVWQYQLSGENTPGGPTWLIEGAAQLIALRSVVQAGILGADEAETRLTRPSGPMVPDLSSLETPESFDVVNAPYDVSCAAVDLLTAERGIESLRTFWRAVAGSEDWQEAFKAAFGETPAAFYERFDASQVRGFGIRAH